ncbi:hypothetical protein B0O99DRAFT_589911 [Bisporella sp. PMI_857]|nr:hypothetical protein B0O99DRAFT_589911 [Bisporella sp. PMI_857]
MEALDGTARQSAILSLMNREKVGRINTDRSYSAPNMAAPTSAIVSPTSIYSNGPPPPYSTGWPPAPNSSLASGLISPPESRRTSDNTEPPPLSSQTASQPQHRQSLPSIHEALSSGPNSNPYASPISGSLPPTHNLPFSQSQAQPTTRPYPPESTLFTPQPPSSRHASPPQPIHPHSNPFGRAESIPVSFPERARHSSLTSIQTASIPPPNPYTAPRYETRYEQDPRASERMANGYVKNLSPQHHAYSYGAGSQISPVSQHPPYGQSRYNPRDERVLDGWKGKEEEKPPAGFQQGLKRHLDVWDFENNLALINISSTLIQEWSRHYNQIAQEQQRQGNPDRMPTEKSCQDMLEQQEKIYHALLRMKETIREQASYAAEQRMRDNAAKGVGNYDEEMSMYDDGRESQGPGNSEGKKRRGRAAPPGRCHSCNRAETPEWRRGPDGARTLCNACGLHYAKLTRKNTMKQSQGSNGSSLRPKDDHSPRPL